MITDVHWPRLLPYATSMLPPSNAGDVARQNALTADIRACPRKREPNEPPKEHPSLLRQMISFHTEKLGYSVSEMAKLLHLRVAEFQEMYRAEAIGAPPDTTGARPQLRVVK